MIPIRVLEDDIKRFREKNEDLRRQRDEGAERYKCLFAEFTRLRTLAGEITTQRDELIQLIEEVKTEDESEHVMGTGWHERARKILYKVTL